MRFDEKNVSDSFTELKTLKIFSLCCLKKIDGNNYYISVLYVCITVVDLFNVSVFYR